MVGPDTERAEPATIRGGRLTPSLASARIVERRDINHELWTIKIEPSIPYVFKPGQYCTIGVDGIERPYSIVSAPEEPALELFIELVPEPDGELTPLLHRLNVGDEVTLRPKPKGIFTFDPKATTHVMVSTVTGVVPYVSILRQYLAKGIQGHQFHVLQGASYQDEFVYDGEFQAMSASHPFITYFPSVSRPIDDRNAGWTGAKGRVNLLVEDYIREHRIDPENTLVYACGHPGMIEDVKERMGKMAYRFREERFWKE
ncbi:MAG: ferredoxin--NADP reductase [Chloroflexi bacterium]|nr:ferredoxin--NADP reductase [Chloroflexota bacterium]